jgi:2'-hydroxyisoflavone reductase
VVGPQDYTDRFTYWPARAVRGGEMLAPGTPHDRIQFIDARDLARFAIDALERNLMGTFNLVAPPGKFTMGDLIVASVDSAKSLAHPTPPPSPTWVAGDFLEKNDPMFETDLPIWSPAHGDSAGFAETSAARALKAGLHITSIRDTVRDTLVWHLARPETERVQLKAGMPPAREQEVLAAWHTQAATRPG